jgi:antitoxin YefM
VAGSSTPIREREAKRKAVRDAAEYTLPTADIAQMLEEIERGTAQRGTDPPPIQAAELACLKETAHLLRSPKNARRLLVSLRRAEAWKGKPESVEMLHRELGLGSGR